MTDFLCHYRRNGAFYSLWVKADSFEDAEGHVAAIRGSLLLDGQIEEKMTATDHTSNDSETRIRAAVQSGVSATIDAVAEQAERGVTIPNLTVNVNSASGGGAKVVMGADTPTRKLWGWWS